MTQTIELLFLGMLTVGLVLALVVLTGRLLIYLVNLGAKVSPPPPPVRSAADQLDPAIVAVLTATVETVTQGKGSIKHINSL